MSKEIINISETLSDGAVVLLNEDFFEENNLDIDGVKKVIDGLFVLSYDSLNNDLELVDKKEKIEISKNVIMSNLVSMVRMILLDDGDFQLLVYFGALADPNTTVRQGLLHILELLAVVETQIMRA